MTVPARRLVVVDAANVVGSRPDGWWRDRAGAAGRLLAELSRRQQQSDRPDDMVVVLEGAARAVLDGPTRPEFPGLTVVSAAGSGDDAIVDVVAAADPGRPITVVTADRELRGRVEALGADTVGPSALRD